MRKTLLKRKKPMKRGTKRLGPGKKTLARRANMREAVKAYFDAHGWETDDGRAAFCQVSGLWMLEGYAVSHHKTPRSELRKSGVQDLDAPERLIICRWDVHNWIHENAMGRPTSEDGRRRFAIVEGSMAHAGNGGFVQFSPQDKLDMMLYVEGKRHA